MRSSFVAHLYQRLLCLPLVLRFVLAALLLGLGTLSTTAQAIPQPEDAFRVTAYSAAPGKVAFDWTIAPEVYLYESKFTVRPGRDTSPRFAILDMAVAAGKIVDDLVCGNINVLERKTLNELHYQLTAATPEVVQLLLSSQGCHSSGFCYPPQTHEVRLQVSPTKTKIPVIKAVDSLATFQRITNDPVSETFTIDDSATDQTAELKSDTDKSATFLNNLLGGSTGEREALDEDNEPTVTKPSFASSGEVLTPEQAFQAQLRYEQDRVVVDIEVNDCCYLYQDKFQLSSESPAVQFGQPDFPAAIDHEDANFGNVWIYDAPMQFAVPVFNTGESTQAEITLHYQGCAKMGICYPPQTLKTSLNIPGNATDVPATVSNPSLIRHYSGDFVAALDPSLPYVAEGKIVDLPSVPGPATLPSADNVDSDNTGGFQNAQDAIVEKFTRDRYRALFWFFLTGLLLSFTPCVFPMIPILSGIIIGQGENISRLRGFTLSLAYVIGMAITYTIAGLIAGLVGANLQIAFQNPWVLGVFAAIFILFALAMFGVFNLQLPNRWQGRLSGITQKLGGSHVSIFFMGALSALIVGPCAAPPLAAVLSVITATGDPVLGGMALFVMGLGMGVPLLIVGLSAGSLLPKAGAWMDGVKYFFGLLMLAVAIVLLERLVGAQLSLILWGALGLLAAVICGAFEPLAEPKTTGKKLFKALGLILAVIGVFEIAGGLMGNRDVYQPLKGLNRSVVMPSNGNSPAELDFITITTPEELDQILQSNAGKPAMIDFYADWCTYCKDFELYTFPDLRVRKALEGFVLIKANITRNDAGNKALLKRFDLIAPPAIIFLSRQGEELRQYRVIKFTKAEPFATHIESLPLP